MSTVNEPKAAVRARIADRTVNVEVLPEHAFRMIETVIAANEAEALRLYPGDEEDAVFSRVNFWKTQLVESVAPQYRGRLAAMYHEYIAATMANEAPEVDLWGFDAVPDYGGESRAQADAYAACTAAL